MCAIAYYLESEGIMTTGIVLVREIAESMQPPRMLWVSFPLGRPLGHAGDAAFQHRVIASALELLDEPHGRVLRDYPEDMKEEVTAAAPACPISFGSAREEDDSWAARLNGELNSLQPWYELSLRRRRRTTVGLCSDSIEEILLGLAAWLDDRSEPLPDFVCFKRAIEDAKAWYAESLTAQPGDYPPGYGEQLMWEQTLLGEALKEYYYHFISQPDLAVFARVIASRAAVGGSTGGSELLPAASDNDDSGIYS